MSDDHRNIGVVINEKDRTHWTYYESAVEGRNRSTGSKQYFSYIGGGNRSTGSKAPICRKSLIIFITLRLYRIHIAMNRNRNGIFN
jgi:hypothetical protein